MEQQVEKRDEEEEEETSEEEEEEEEEEEGACADDQDIKLPKVKLPKIFKRKKKKKKKNEDVGEEEPDGLPVPVPESHPGTTPHMYRDDRSTEVKNPASPPEETSNDYNLSRKKLGKALVFVNEKFDDERYNRVGAEADKKNYRETFQHLGFEVIEYPDLSADKILGEIKTFCGEDHTDESCVVVAFSSHGQQQITHNKQGKLGRTVSKDVILARDKAIDLEVILKLLSKKCPSLEGQPKLFFFQACRGYGYDEVFKVKAGSPAQKIKKFDQLVPDPPTVVRLPIAKDFFMAYSSPPGYISFRRETGSWFVRELCTVIKEHGFHLELHQLMAKVSQNVSQNYSYQSTFTPEERKLEKRGQMVLQSPHITKKLGKALVFVNKAFIDRENYPPRLGAELDLIHYQGIFRKLGFHMEPHIDKYAAEIEDIIKEYCEEDHTDNAYLALAFSTHENVNITHNDVIMARDKPINIHSILQQISSVGKPKLILFQACRGYDVQTVSHFNSDAQQDERLFYETASRADLTTLPLTGDFYLAYSRPASYYSFRQEGTGSFFVTELHDVITNKEHPLDLEKVMTEVQERLTKKYYKLIVDPLMHGRRIVPFVSSMLLKNVCFQKPQTSSVPSTL